MTKLIVYIVSVILVSILGFLSIQSAGSQPPSFFKSIKQLAGLMVVDLVLVFLGVYLYLIGN